MSDKRTTYEIYGKNVTFWIDYTGQGFVVCLDKEDEADINETYYASALSNRILPPDTTLKEDQGFAELSEYPLQVVLHVEESLVFCRRPHRPDGFNSKLCQTEQDDRGRSPAVKQPELRMLIDGIAQVDGS